MADGRRVQVRRVYEQPEQEEREPGAADADRKSNGTRGWIWDGRE